MTFENYIRSRVVKTVNSRLGVKVRIEQDCDKKFISELNATQYDIFVVGSMIERLFSIIIEDEVLADAETVNDFVKIVSERIQKHVHELVFENA